MEIGKVLRVVTIAGAADKLLEAMGTAGLITIADLPDPAAEEAPHVICANCKSASAGPLPYDRRFDGAVCLLCRSTADRVEQLFNAGARLHWQEFTRQLPQMVRDIRAGADEPTFYRGFE